MVALTGALWRKSTRSGSNGGDCVEVAETCPASSPYATARTRTARRSPSPHRLDRLRRRPHRAALRGWAARSALSGTPGRTSAGPLKALQSEGLPEGSVAGQRASVNHSSAKVSVWRAPAGCHPRRPRRAGCPCTAQQPLPPSRRPCRRCR